MRLILSIIISRNSIMRTVSSVMRNPHYHVKLYNCYIDNTFPAMRRLAHYRPTISILVWRSSIICAIVYLFIYLRITNGKRSFDMRNFIWKNPPGRVKYIQTTINAYRDWYNIHNIIIQCRIITKRYLQKAEFIHFPSQFRINWTRRVTFSGYHAC